MSARIQTRTERICFKLTKSMNCKFTVCRLHFQAVAASFRPHLAPPFDDSLLILVLIGYSLISTHWARTKENEKSLWDFGCDTWNVKIRQRSVASIDEVDRPKTYALHASNRRQVKASRTRPQAPCEASSLVAFATLRRTLNLESHRRLQELPRRLQTRTVDIPPLRRQAHRTPPCRQRQTRPFLMALTGSRWRLAHPTRTLRARRAAHQATRDTLR